MKKRIGKIVKIFGIRGELKVLSTSSSSDRRYVKKSKVIIDNYERSIESVRKVNEEMFIVKLEGVNDANAAELLIGKDILMDVASVPGEFFIDDLIGLKLVDSKNKEVARIDKAFDFNSIIYLSAEGKLIPFQIGIFIEEVSLNDGVLRLTAYGDGLL